MRMIKLFTENNFQIGKGIFILFCWRGIINLLNHLFNGQFIFLIFYERYFWVVDLYFYLKVFSFIYKPFINYIACHWNIFIFFVLFINIPSYFLVVLVVQPYYFNFITYSIIDYFYIFNMYSSIVNNIFIYYLFVYLINC